MPRTTTPTALERQIASQPGELARLLEEPLPNDALDRLGLARRIWLVGTGTSQHAAELGAMMLHEAGRDATAASSMHFVNWAPPIDRGDALVLISHNAGAETAYAGAAWAIAVDAGLGVVPITRIGGRLPDAIHTVEKETSHTYTVSYTAVLLMLARIAHELGAERFDRSALERVPEAVRAAIDDPDVDHVAPPNRLLVLTGEGPASITAREGALKVREASRFPCEGYDVEYLLHGHAVPLNADDRLVLVTPPDRDGLVAAVGRAAEREGIPVAHLHDGADLPPMLAQIPLVVRLQRLALRFATERGTNPDVAIEGAWADEDLWAIGSPASSAPE
jgi:glucosamine--fructose-6-phosphate aminotransferase (isomerizing)